MVATVGSDSSGRVWAFPSGRLLTVLLGHTNYVTSAAFSPDNFSVVTTSDDRTAQVWKPDTGAIRAVLGGDADSVTGAYVPQGRHRGRDGEQRRHRQGLGSEASSPS